MSAVYALIDEPHTVALCDVCDERTGTKMVTVCGLETWTCDRCRGQDEEDESSDNQ